MVINNYKIILFTVAVIFSFVFSSCKNEYPTSLYDENAEYKPNPSITALLPDSAFAGVDTVEITGTNFSKNPADIAVFFNGIKGEVLSSTETEVRVIPAKIISDSVEIKLSVIGALKFADFQNYKLKSAVKILHDFAEYERPYGITTDSEENVYFCFTSLNGSEGIKKITPEGIIEDFAPKKGEAYYTALRYGADSKIYGTWSPLKRAVFASASGEMAKALAVADNNAKFYALEFDNNLNIWAGGLGGNIFRISIDGTSTEAFPFTPIVKSIRYYNGFLYAVGIEDSSEIVWRFPIVGTDKLGAPEEYFNVRKNLPDYSINDITFTVDGTLLLGTNAQFYDEYSIIAVKSDGTYTPWFPGVINGPVLNMTWGNGVYLYYIRQEIDAGATQTQTIVRVNMKSLGAPYFGRD